MSLSIRSTVLRFSVVTCLAIGFSATTALPSAYRSAACLNMHGTLSQYDDQSVLTRKIFGPSTGRAKSSARARAERARANKQNESQSTGKPETLAPAERETVNVPATETSSPPLTYVSNPTHALQDQESKAHAGKWNFFVYIAACNNLYRFTQRNIKQMVALGSNKHINIIVQIDQWGTRQSTRYFIERGVANVVSQETSTLQNATGTPDSLFDFVRWGTARYPAEQTAIVLWNHGCGILDPHIWGRLMMQDRDDLFFFNPETCLLELDRKPMPRGVAFNDTFQTYLTNTDLRNALNRIRSEVLNGKKIDLVGMDACHMAMVEVGSQIKDSTKYFVASQEVEPGSGWNYTHVLAPLEHGSLTPHALAQQIVEAYRKEYVGVTNDYTQSALNLEKIELLEKNISAVSNTLVAMLSSRDSADVSKYLKRIRLSNAHTTAFYNHNYVDLRHFYESLYNQTDSISEGRDARAHIPLLKQQLEAGMNIIQHITIANAAGPSMRKASGISIYFPTRSIHSSYMATVFCRNTSWINFISEYVKRAGRDSEDGVNSAPDSVEHQFSSGSRESSDDGAQSEEDSFIIIDDQYQPDSRLPLVS